MGKKKRKVWEYYEISDGKLIRKKKICPKCGEGVYLAEHKDRWSCGKCGYTEWKTERKEVEVPELGIKIHV